MAQNRMMAPALLEQLQGADTDVLRRVLEHAMQRLIEAEAAIQIGAGPHERSASRTTYRNGYRERILDTGSGRLELQIPKLRMGALHAARGAMSARVENVFGYPEPVWKLFVRPRRVGTFNASDTGVVFASAGTPAAKSVLSLAWKTDGGRIVDARFQAYGCPVTIAVGEWLAERSHGSTVEAVACVDDVVGRLLGGDDALAQVGGRRHRLESAREQRDRLGVLIADAAAVRARGEVLAEIAFLVGRDRPDGVEGGDLLILLVRVHRKA